MIIGKSGRYEGFLSACIDNGVFVVSLELRGEQSVPPCYLYFA